MSTKRTARLFYGNPERDADLLYFGKFSAPDPFLAIGVGRRKIAVLSDLELGRGRRESGFTDVLSLSEVRQAAAKAFRLQSAGTLECIRYLARVYGVQLFEVPSGFPASLAFQMKAARLPLRVVDDPFLPGREVKSDQEAECIREGNRASARGFEVARAILREARITAKGTLNWRNRPLTSEIVQREIEKALLDLGARSEHTIVAGGDQACDPHERGSGILRARELIIIDIFPRVLKSGYFGDMTRTFLRGAPSDDQVRLVETVKAAQDEAMKHLRPGVTGDSVHQRVKQFFEEQGYSTERTREGFRGFFHGTGHGLGLEVHEPPRISASAPRLRKHAVVTVEPGLYYPGLGGCRIEDVVRLVGGGCELLSGGVPYDWVI